MTSPPRPIIVDCDTGVDDALALLYLCGDPAADLVAVGTVDGNVPAPLGAGNTLRVLAVAGRSEVPVAVGCRRPLVDLPRYATTFHGMDGLGDTHLPASPRAPVREGAVNQLLRLARSRPGELTLLAIGPLTNVAVALILDPELPELLGEVVVMGGAITVPGNETPWAEFNIAHDPEAAEVVLRTKWRRLTMVPLDATSGAVLRGPAVARLRGADAPSCRLAAEITRQRLTADGSFELCDPLAAGVALDPGLVDLRQAPVRVELHGLYTRAATLADLRTAAVPEPERPSVEIAMGVDGGRFMERFLARLGAHGEVGA
ncbi:MAG: nucleoside hydrolase [Candidatus Dormibacteria bacterium]